MQNDPKNKINEDTRKFQQTEPPELDDAALLKVAGGMRPETAWTYCDQVPTQCYKPNPY